MESRVVASPDGAHLAVLRDRRLSLFALDTGRRVGSAEVSGTELAFAGNHIVVHARSAQASVITVLTLPGLTVSASHELTAATRLMAAANSYALLDRGDQALVIHCGRGAAVTPMRPPAAFTHAVGLDGPQFVTFGTRGAELWDADSRRPEARLRLELPADTLAIGLASRHALLWAATSQPCLHLARISDGRISTLWLDATPRNVRSHPVAAWVVADVGSRPVAINLAIGDLVPLEAGHSEIVAVAPRRDRDTGAVVVFLDGDALELRLLGGEARPMPRREGDAPDAPEVEVDPAAPPAVEGADLAARPAPLADPGGARRPSLQERLGQKPPGADRVIPPAQVVPSPAPSMTTMTAPMTTMTAPSLAERISARSQARSIGAPLGPHEPDHVAAPAHDPAPPEPEPVPYLSLASSSPSLIPAPHPSPDPSQHPSTSTSLPSPSPSPSPSTSTPTPASMNTSTAPAIAVPKRSPIPTLSRPPSWRDELITWIRSRAPVPPPALDGAPLRLLHLQLGLAPAAWPIACALYARWLLGGGDRGMATARLATLTGEASPATWSEALGAGGLGSLGLVEFRHGRACLAGAVGDFLDERAPAAVELIGVGRHRAPRPGQAQQIGEGVAAARDHAVRLADELGQVALAANAGALAQARLEAWLRGLALVVVGDPGPLVLRPDEAVLAVVPLAVGRSF